ncbi:MAG: BrnT family toxin [Pseudobdellovibrionaceae bacterium]
MLAEDESHSEKEDRLMALGLSFKKRILFVAFTYRRSSSYEKEIYRIISARIANKNERKVYK